MILANLSSIFHRHPQTCFCLAGILLVKLLGIAYLLLSLYSRRK